MGPLGLLLSGCFHGVLRRGSRGALSCWNRPAFQCWSGRRGVAWQVWNLASEPQLPRLYDVLRLVSRPRERLNSVPARRLESREPPGQKWEDRFCSSPTRNNRNSHRAPHGTACGRCESFCRSRTGYPATQAVERKQAAGQEAAKEKQDRRQEQWRFAFHKGEWWYWLPENRWVYWRDNRWNDYDPRTHAADRPSDFIPMGGTPSVSENQWSAIPTFVLSMVMLSPS